jgi:Uma2 family endonuclease
MAQSDQYGHRYEMSSEGTLSIMPPAGVEHAIVASKLFGWLLTGGWPPEQVLQNCGLRLVTAEGVGGRVPDLSVWSVAPKMGGVWVPTHDLLLAVEIVSPGSEAMDRVVKKDGYPAAGVPHYWIINRDTGHTVTMWQAETGGYQPTVSSGQPLAWLLNTHPTHYLGQPTKPA